MDPPKTKIDLSLLRPPPGIQTLVKYETPVLVAIHDKMAKIAAAKKAAQANQGGFSGITRAGNLAHCIDAGGITKKETEEILQFIFPPVISEDGSKNTWRQMVSSAPSTRIDIIRLEEQFNAKLKEMNAKETGICLIRRELYAQCFDELIRQITISCAERGLLIVRVRDEFYQTLSANRALYESSTAYGMRKALKATTHRHELEQRIRDIQREKEYLALEAAEIEGKMKEIHDRYVRKKELEDIRMNDELEQLQKINKQIKQQLETIIIPKKKHDDQKDLQAALAAEAARATRAKNMEMAGEDGDTETEAEVGDEELIELESEPEAAVDEEMENEEVEAREEKVEAQDEEVGAKVQEVGAKAQEIEAKAQEVEAKAEAVEAQEEEEEAEAQEEE